jgi:hypothetical protein
LFDEVKQLFRFEGLFDEIHRPAADRGNRGVDIAVTGKDDDRQVRLALLDGVEHLQPVHRAAVQPYVKQHQARPLAVDFGQRAGAVAAGPAFIALVAQHAGDELADVAFVVDHQDFQCHALSFSSCCGWMARLPEGTWQTLA